MTADPPVPPEEEPTASAGLLPIPSASHESLALDALISMLALPPDTAVLRGQARGNTFAIAAWELPAAQHWQFGDLRLELSGATYIVEVESAGGVTNLVKYWPLLRQSSLSKRLVIAHVFRRTSGGDYASHLQLWDFLVAQMREDLERHGVEWRKHWLARRFAYAQPVASELQPVAAFLLDGMTQTA